MPARLQCRACLRSEPEVRIDPNTGRCSGWLGNGGGILMAERCRELAADYRAQEEPFDEMTRADQRVANAGGLGRAHATRVLAQYGPAGAPLYPTCPACLHASDHASGRCCYGLSIGHPRCPCEAQAGVRP